MKICDLLLVQKGKSSQLGILLSAHQNQLESITFAGHLMLHTKKHVKFASLQWGLNLEKTRSNPILPESEKKILEAGMDLSVLSHLNGFHKAAVERQHRISPLVKPFHSTLDPTSTLDLDTITKNLFKNENVTPAEKYSVIRVLEDSLYFTRTKDPYNPIFKPRTQTDIQEILYLLDPKIHPNSELDQFIKTAQTIISEFRKW
jgi:hypothetical protein